MSSSIEVVLLAVSLGVGPCGEPGAPTTGSTPERPISLADAERIALEHLPGGTVEDIERDHRLGKPVIEVEVRAEDGREHELVIDEGGRVISEEIDD